MSICTKRGDEGMTDLLFGKRVPKTHARVAACGAVDELNAVLGIVRNSGATDEMQQWVNEVQQKLVGLMGVIATDAEDHERYTKAGYTGIEQEDVEWLEDMISQAEKEEGIKFKGWVRPGESGILTVSYVDQARTICRRSELASWAIEDDALTIARKFLNRLSDALWLLARGLEK